MYPYDRQELTDDTAAPPPYPRCCRFHITCIPRTAVPTAAVQQYAKSASFVEHMESVKKTIKHQIATNGTHPKQSRLPNTTAVRQNNDCLHKIRYVLQHKTVCCRGKAQNREISTYTHTYLRTYAYLSRTNPLLRSLVILPRHRQ